MQSQQPEAKHHERKSGAVIHACLAGEGEAQAVAVLAVANLYLGSEHRVGGRNDRTEQNCRAHGHAEYPVGETCNQAYRYGHRYCRQQNRHAPVSETYRDGHLDPRRKQRQQHDHFREDLKQRRLLKGVEVEQAKTSGADYEADDQIDDGSGDRQATDQRRGQSHGEHEGTHKDEPAAAIDGQDS